MSRVREPTEPQKAMWFLRELRPGSFAYNIAFVARLAGSFDCEAFSRAAQRVVLRHGSLRTYFRAGESGLPMVHLEAISKVDLIVRDERSSSSACIERDLLAYHRAPFDLRVDRPIRFCVLRVGNDDHIVLITVHHIVGDFRSLEVISADLELLYLSEVGKAGTKEPSAAGQSYTDAWEDVVPTRQRLQTSERYWGGRLSGTPDPIAWPFFRAGKARLGGYLGFHLGKREKRALRRLAQSAGSTTYVAVLAAWAVTIKCLTEEAEIVVGMPVSLRPKKWSQAVGDFVNILPVRCAVNDSRSIAQIRSAFMTDVLQAISHRHVSLGRIVQISDSVRSAGRDPLFQTVVNYQRADPAAAWSRTYLNRDFGNAVGEWAGLAVYPVSMSQGEGSAELLLEVVDAGQDYYCALKSDGRNVPQAALTYIAGLFQRILIELEACRPATTVREIVDRVNAKDSSKGLRETAMQESLMDRDLVGLVDRSITAYPKQVSLVDGKRAVSYRELGRRSSAIARALRDLGIRRGERVAVESVPSADTVIAMLGIMRAGGAYVPIDRTAPRVRRDHILESAGIRFMLSDTIETASAFANVQLLSIRNLSAEPCDEVIARAGDLAYVTTTSGSTGMPKGIEVSHDAVVAMLKASQRRLELRDNERWTWLHAATFDLSVWEIWGCLSTGGTLVVVSELAVPQPDILLDLLAETRANVVTVTPTALEILGEEYTRRSGKGYRIRTIVCCGEPLVGRVARKFVEQGSELWNLYGPAEATVFTTAIRVGSAACRDDVVRIGEPLEHARIVLRDRSLREVADGETGEIWISGRGLANGYLGRPDETKARFVNLTHGSMWRREYRSGDLAHWKDGSLWFDGRVDRQVKVRGYRIELEDIEASLLRLPIIRAAAVCIDRSNSARLVAFVVLSSTTSEAKILAMARTALPKYMLPERFMIVDRMPLTRHNKADRERLLRLLENAQEDAVQGYHSSEDGREAVEAFIAQVWSEVLLIGSGIGIDEAFFDIGGNSLALMEVFCRLQSDPLFKDIRASDLYRYSTIRLLAEAVTYSNRVGHREIGRDGAARDKSMQRIRTVAQRRMQ